MRILVVQESDWLDRGPHQQHHLMERLSSDGNEVRVIDFEIAWRTKPRKEFCTRRRVVECAPKICSESHVNIFRPAILKLPLLDYTSILFTHSNEIRRQIVEFSPEVIVGLGILNTFMALQIAKQHRIPFVYYLIDALHTLLPIKELRFLGKMLESETLRHSDAICVINEALKDYAIKLGAPPKKIHVVRAGVDTERFNPSLDRDKLRAELGIQAGDVVLFFMGWVYPFSGLKEIASALVSIKDSYPHLKLLVVGKGDAYRDLQQIRESDSEQLILVGWQPYERIPEYVATADICLLPAEKNEVMEKIVPIKMYEYMACGKPVISSKLPGIIREFGYDNGVIYADESMDVLRKAIELSNSGERIREYGCKARQFVGENSWNKVVSKFEKILEDLVRIQDRDGIVQVQTECSLVDD
jgi:glycosyltransferase involved in cell wall biosynthesis